MSKVLYSRADTGEEDTHTDTLSLLWNNLLETIISPLPRFNEITAEGQSLWTDLLL